MKRILSFLSIFILTGNVLFAQLQNGSTAPDWTLNDINNVPRNLYSYLNNNKIVFLDFSATWCGPCWNYHQSGALETLYEQHGPPGTNNVMVFMIEADASTNLACLYDQPSCSGAGTWGNWVTGTPYPIIDNASLNNSYDINYFPTIYAVCPNKKIYELSQMGANDLWVVAQWCSAPDLTLNNVTHVNCYGNHNGAISVSIADGIPPFTYQWSNGATTQSISNLAGGQYTLTVTGSLGGTKTLGPITVNEASAPLGNGGTTIQAEGCAGMGGQIEIQPIGGTPNYTIQWSNGTTGPVNTGLMAGNYAVSIADANGCTFTQTSMVVAPPTYPVAAATAPAPLTCTTPMRYLNGNGSSTGPQYNYFWSTADGFINSGANTLNNCLIESAGNYLLMVENTTNNCQSFAYANVQANQVHPNVTAGPPGTISCANPQATLNAVGPTGPNFNVLWTTPDGNIVSGATTLTPVVNLSGSYTLTITDTANGCSGSSTTMVTSSIAPPNISATGGAITCTASNVTLNGNSTTQNVTYAWTGPNGFTSNQQNPNVTAQGAYVLTVTSPANGCTATATATVLQNTTAPQASAQGGAITCTNANVNLSGSSTTPNVTYGWIGPNGFTSNQQNPTVNATGNYVLTVTGSNGCTQTATGIVSQNTTPPTANAGPSGVLNCQANQVVLNGTSSSSGSQFAYLWTTSDGQIASGATSLTPTVDEAGSYLLTVSNGNNGCTSTASTSVVLRQALAASIAAQTNVGCNGGASGSATVAGSGGNGSFTYAWSNGVNAATSNNLSAGTYIVVVTDGENCEATKIVTITQPATLVVNASTTAQTAPGVNDGSATANPQGGSGNFTFQWNNGENSQSISGLAPGNYTVVVTDGNGCQKSQTVTVNTFGCAVSSNLIGQDATCHGANDGTASISLSNSVLPQVFEWSNGSQTAEITDLAPGAYTVTATDGNGCEVVASVEIAAPNPLSANATTTGLTATNANDGTATANPTGGTAPFGFVWSNGQTTSTISGLPSANYTVSVTDANGCTDVQTVPVAPFTCSLGANVSASNITCFGEADGEATVSILGNLTPFTYNWLNESGENMGTSATIEGLSAGTYTANISDAVNCQATIEVTILEPAALVISLNEATDTDCGATNGNATVAASGGTTGNSNYSFAWSNGAAGSTVNGLGAGSYSVSASDENGCEATLDIEIKINDAEPPIALTQNMVIALDANGLASLDASQIDNGSSDNCMIASMNIDQTSFDCSHLGANEVLLSVVDIAGNLVTATASVQVVDNMPPAILVQNLTIYLDDNGMASITPQQLDSGSSDNCGIAEQSIDIASFTCADFGQNAVVLTVKDASGNQASGTAIVNVQDNIAPTLTCPVNQVLAYCDPVSIFSITASDNCAQNLSPIQVAGLPSGATFPMGTTAQIFQINDGHGNLSTCSFTIEVPAAMEVDLEVDNIACFGEINGSASANITGGGLGYSYLWSTGETTQVIENLGPGQVSVSVTDADGCSVFQSAIVTEPSTISTTIIQITNADPNLQNGAIDITVEGGTAPYSFVWTNTSGVVLGNQEDLFDLFPAYYNLAVTDANGCEYSQTFIVQYVSSIQYRQLERKIQLFPNPASRLVTLKFDEIDAHEVDIQLFDLTGQLVATHPRADVSSGSLELNLSDMLEGVFMVRIMLENQVVVKRLVIQK